MQKSAIIHAVRTILVVLIVLILGGLAGWYFYITSRGAQTVAIDTARGSSTSSASFGTSATRSLPIPQNPLAQTTTFNAARNFSASSSNALWKVDATPVAGAGFVMRGGEEYLYYVERGNGYVFGAIPQSHSLQRVTDTLFPKVYEAQFARDGSVIERSLDSRGRITTFLGTISSSSTPVLTSIHGTATSSTIDTLRTQITKDSRPRTTTTSSILSGVYLEPGVTRISMSPLTRTLFLLVPNQSGGVDGYSQDWNGTKRTKIFSSLIRSWEPRVLEDGRIIMSERAADGIAGYSYVVGKSGSLSPLVRDTPGLLVVPKSASSALIYSSSSGESVTLYAQATSTPIALALQTIADKCVWLSGQTLIAYCAVPRTAPPASFLDNWYRGVVHTSDDWWRIDLSSDTLERVPSGGSNGESFDVVHPTIDSTGNYIAFINAVDQSLWTLHVAQ